MHPRAIVTAARTLVYLATNYLRGLVYSMLLGGFGSIFLCLCMVKLVGRK